MGRQEDETEGRGRQWIRVRGSFIRSKYNFTRPFSDERRKKIRQFGPKRACYISLLLNFFHFLVFISLQ
jgi:hypothetical protein